MLLDEIGELRPELQAKLLRVIESRRYFPVGATRELVADVRILAATNRDPEEEVRAGRLRRDLYYRLATVVVRVPPLRDRREDIPTLAIALLGAVRLEVRAGPSAFDEEALAALGAHAWPGNVRELRNLIERLAILVDREVITRHDVARHLHQGGNGSPPMPASPMPPAFVPRPLEDVARAAAEAAEREHIVATLAHVGGNCTAAAELLRVSRSTLWRKLRELGLEEP